MKIARIPIALSAALLLGACNLFEGDPNDEAPGESGLTSPWIGKPLDSLAEISAFALRGGRLIVANRHATAPGVAVVDTASGLITEYYPEIVAPSGMAFTASGHLIVTETSFDYLEGSVSVVDLDAKRIRKSAIHFGSDNGVASAGDGKVYLFDRSTGAVTGFTGNTPGAGVSFDVQTGASSNPYGIAVAGGKAYIPRYNLGSLLVLDATLLGGGARDSIDLSAYSKDTARFIPRMASVTAHGGHVFVTLQRLKADYSANDTALVVVINASTKAIEKTIPLLFRNPVATEVQGDFLYITGIAGYGDQSGGVEKINLSTRLHAGAVISEATLAADAFGFVPAENGTGYVSYSTDFGFHTRVKKVGSLLGKAAR